MRLPPPLLAPTRVQRAWPDWLSDGDGHDSPEDELQRWSSLIGIITAICGNILIALALNVQRYAHIRLHRRKVQAREWARQARHAASQQSRGPAIYGAAGTSGPSNGAPNGTPALRYSDDDDHHDHAGPRGSSETDPLAQSFRSDDSADDHPKPEVSSTYLKDPYWWLGQVLITVGESGNFLAYGFAPASIVSPLGVVALVSNCVIAPIVFKEVFRQQDFWGVIIAITGAVTVVLSANTEETKLGPHEVWDAITTMEFEIYVAVTCGLIVLLMWLSPRYGKRTILIDLGLVGLFGGYTVLSTKGVSSMLSSTLLGAFTTPVTYALLFILLSTAIMQVRYVNKALQRFDSTQVIPIQFVLFTLCVIIGSAVLYRDFERTTSEQAVKFVGGCCFTFFGVFLITSGRPRHDEEDEAALSDAEGIEETIGLAEQDRAPPTPTTPRTSRSSSSRHPRVSFSDARTGIPTPRRPHSSRQKPLHLKPHQDEDSDSDEDRPLLSPPWDDPLPTTPEHHPKSLPPLPIPPSTPPPRPSLSAGVATAGTATAAADRPQTPARVSSSINRLPGSQHGQQHQHQHQHVYSPSPFASTLSAVVGDKLRGNLPVEVWGEEFTGTNAGGGANQGGFAGRSSVDGAGKRRVGLRGSLFGPGPLSEEEEEAGHLQRRTSSHSQEDGGDNDGSGGQGGFRGRARSLSQTLGLGGLWGGSKKGPDGGRDDGDGGALERARTAGEGGSGRR